MPKNEKGLIDNVRLMLDKVYGKTYYNPRDARNTLNTLNKTIDKSIDNIIDKNINSNGANLSRIYSRLNPKDINKGDMVNGIDNIFKNDDMMDGLLYNYMGNKYIRDLDIEIDVICTYLPKLEEALEVKRDAVLTADVFSNSYLNISNITSNNDDTFSSNIKEVDNIYKISEIADQSYMRAVKYGEDFIYVLPYKKAFTDLLKTKDKHMSDINEGGNIVINESGISVDGKIDKSYDTSMIGENMSISINLSNSPILESIVQESSMYKPKETIDYSKLDIDDLGSQESLISAKEKTHRVDVNGCIVRTLNRENVIPIYIEEVCLGYYYIESSVKDMFEYIEDMHDPLAKMKKGTKSSLDDIDNRSDTMIRNISKKLSSVIDDKFINKNQDLRKELYYILKHNYEKSDGANLDLKVTFIPPEDMIHFYFNKDKKSNRGISHLSKSLLPAKLYSCLYITNTIGILTRSQDKRAYFVKQHIDTNISKLMLNTINQIKKANFGMREVNNMNNILNIAGRYNDYVIPVSQSGERPIDFEVIQGQDINTNDEFMERMESMAINPIGVPLELIDSSRSIDFARQLTTSNGKFARNVLKEQITVQRFISELTSKIYNHHFNKNDILECILPPPAYLTLSNTNELMNSTKDLVNDIVEIRVSNTERDEPWVAKFANNLTMHYLSTYLNVDNIERIEKISKIEAAQEIKKDDQQGY